MRDRVKTILASFTSDDAPDLNAEVEGVLTAISMSFEKDLEDKGDALERTLDHDQRQLLEELERLHLDRSGAIGGQAFELGFELGKVFGKRPSVNPDEPIGSS